MPPTIVIRVRGDTAANWENKNSVLSQREPGYDMTNKRLKVGDGLTAWKDLPYVDPDIINDLITGGIDKALSAEQGKNLKGKLDTLETKVTNIIETGGTPIEDSLLSDDATYALSAKQGKILKGLVDEKTSVEIVDNLTDGGSDKALSAEQGKVLSNKTTEITQNITNITQNVINKDDLTSEVWKFTLSDDTEVEKKVALWSS